MASLVPIGVRRGCFVLVVLVSLAVLFAPGDAVPTAPTGTDKVVHAALFLALALTGRLALLAARPLALGLAAYAAASEAIQAWAPLARSGSVLDLLTDLAGIALGLLLFAPVRDAPR